MIAMPPDRGRRGRHDARPIDIHRSTGCVRPRVGRKILQRPDAAVRPYAGDQIRRDPARVETLRALIRNGFQGVRQIRLLDHGAYVGNPAVRGQEGFRASGERSRTSACSAMPPAGAHTAEKPLAREADRGLQALLSTTACRICAPGTRTPRARRNGRGQGPEIDASSMGLPALVQIHVARTRPRRSRVHRAWFRSRRLADAANRSRRRPDPNCWVRPPRVPPIPPPPHRRHCRPPPEFPGPLGSPMDRHWRWPPCAQPRCARGAGPSPAADGPRAERPRSHQRVRPAARRRMAATSAATKTPVYGRARRGTGEVSLKACDAA